MLLSDPRIAVTWAENGDPLTRELRADADRRRSQLSYSEKAPLVLQVRPARGAISVVAAQEDYAVLCAVRDSPTPGLLGSIAVSTLLTCADGLVLAVRAQHLDTAAGQLSATASEAVNMGDVRTSQDGSLVDVNDVSLRALFEEVGLPPDRISVSPLLALLHGDGLATFTASFTDMSFREVVECQRSAQDWEGTLELCPYSGLEASQRPVIPWLPLVYSQWRETFGPLAGSASLTDSEHTL